MTEFFSVLATDLGAIPTLAAAFESWAEGEGVPPDVVFPANLVLDELITNVILYGLGEGRPGEIRVRIWIEGSNLHAELRDNAQPFDPFSVPPPNLMGDIDERAVGGLGVHFVRSMMDEWSYVRDEPWNVVRLRKVMSVRE